MEIKLGRIKSARFGECGYQECGIGMLFDLSGEGWGVRDDWWAWSPARMPRSDHANWTEEDRDRSLVDVMRRIDKLLADAKVRDVSQLAGIPIEVTFDGMLLKSWRVLTEVL